MGGCGERTAPAPEVGSPAPAYSATSLAGDPVWKHHPHTLGTGGAQMYAYDVDGDGDNDVITSLQAHGYGLAWFEHVNDRPGHDMRYAIDSSKLRDETGWTTTEVRLPWVTDTIAVRGAERTDLPAWLEAR